MRAVMLQVPQSLVDERRRLGIDVFDALWDGVLHRIPPPKFLHQSIGTERVAFLAGPLRERGIGVRYETGVFRPGSNGQDDRVPDPVFFRPDEPGVVGERGIEGPLLCVVEIRSPDDETCEKLPFTAQVGAREIA